ncbi:hypothetical protein F5B22DRAFT_571482 [Xylaria bambusicola]|uniref:uncharacterized protein n=1 Tax=Xylaria bambusicola TaxID=326684 RepID=UPI002007EA20|nr:uncharacterized protein F5B22DRAFT_571482 [Xylaria bambusicola]KAI0521383.1 hypothetical protein F5B22DRAFT_571482 [Xylaria bambusicola]
MMMGPSLASTVSSTVESTQSLPSSSLPPSSPGESSTARTGLSLTSALSRGKKNKSLPDLPVYAVPSINFDVDGNLDLDLSFDTAVISAPDPTPSPTNENPAGSSIRYSSGGSRPRTEIMGRRKSMVLSRPQSWIPSSRSTPDLGCLPQPAVEGMVVDRAKDKPTVSIPPTQDGSRTVSDSFASFAKRSWISASRSPSPNKRQEATGPPEERFGRERAPSNSSVMKLRKGSRNRSDSSSSESTSARSNESMSKIGNYLNKIKPRPHTIRTKTRLPNELGSSASSTTSLAPPSTETRKSHASETSNSTYPDDATTAANPSTARDPLWTAFKHLEVDFQRFQSKPTALKMSLIRASLVPFLQKYATDPSHLNLHHEDLERRAIILNSWWTGLLEMLHVRFHPPVPGVDRPILLDAVSHIMMRPEWRQSTPTFRPLAERNPQERTRGKSQLGFKQPNDSTGSLHSADSAYLAESTGHNVRNMFTANLVSQIALVVEKMSLRHAPISLINFAGKACAYAFFFAPGVADVLVRLWCLTPKLLRRITDELKLPRRSRGESDDIVALFPHCMEKLGWTSVVSLSEALRKPAQPPLASTKIPWTGPWIGRWNGRDSDLFFIFCKYYFILADDFTPPGLPLIEKARAPGFVLVNAQLLSVLDSTIHRQAAIETPLPDAFNGADASLMPLQVAPSNSNILKGMSENRLVVLLKNLLSDASVSSDNVRCTFAASFLGVMKAAVKQTSQFNHAACFTICDFLEESLVIYNDFVVGSCPHNVDVDWPFWVEVCKKILESNNSMSEIRVLSFIFSIWETIASDQSRKERVCLDWLLAEETFDKLFNNWCPMVRAYYMRLLCWRICRDAGNANDSDARIFLLVFTRLKTVWSHYLWLKQDSEQKAKLPPSTAPSFPTPGKRFMIIRTEIPTIQSGFIAGFDSLPTSPRQDTSGAPPTDFDSMNTSNLNPEHTGTANTKKTWSIFGKIFSPSTNVGDNDDLETLRRETAAARTSVAHPPRISTRVASPTNSDADSIGSSPTFEATQYLFKFILSWNNAGTMPPPNRILTRPRLPNPAQSWVIMKGQGSSPPPIAGRPAPTRAVSGSALPGLVDSAKNADISEVHASPSSSPTPLDGRDSIGQFSFTDLHEDDMPLRAAAGLSKENLVNPVKPTGTFARSVKYAGRALAEWSLVVAECNSFVERRREEGVLGLQDVEVPALSVEGFRKISG